VDQNKPGQRPHKPDTQSFRNLVLTLAVSVTIGFWAIFSRLDNSNASGGDVPEQFVNDVPFSDQESQSAFNLPPIPTLIPALSSNQLGQGAANDLAAPVSLGAALPAPTILKTPQPGAFAPRTDKDPTIKKVKIGGGGGGGGGKTTNTRSS
jgi:hypothetical protein